MKVISVQELIARRRCARLAPAITTLARAEGLEAHARSVEVRRGCPMKAPKLPKGAIRPRPAVLAMAPYSPPTGGRAGKLRLDFNENTVGCSPRVIDGSARTARRPPASPSIPSTARPRKPSPTTSACGPKQFVFTNGTDEAIQVFINTYVDDGQEVRACCKPAYAMYRFYAEVAGREDRRGRLPAARHGIPAAGGAGRDHAGDARRPDRQSE